MRLAEATLGALSPAFVVLALGVCLQIIFALKPLGAFDAVVLPKTREIFGIFGRLVLRQMSRGFDVGADLVVVSLSDGLANSNLTIWRTRSKDTSGSPVPRATLGFDPTQSAHRYSTTRRCPLQKEERKIAEPLSPIPGVLLGRSGAKWTCEISSGDVGGDENRVGGDWRSASTPRLRLQLYRCNL